MEDIRQEREGSRKRPRGSDDRECGCVAGFKGNKAEGYKKAKREHRGKRKKEKTKELYRLNSPS